MKRIVQVTIEGLVLVMCVMIMIPINNHRALAYSSPVLNDMDNQYCAKDSILTRYDRGIIGTTVDGKCHPNKPITRFSLIQLLVKAINKPIVNGSQSFFTDVIPNSNMAAVVQTAINDGLIDKNNHNTAFHPNTYVTRGELAIWVARYLHLNPSQKIDNISDLHSYPQEPLIDSLVTHHVMNVYSDLTFRPNNLVTKAEAAATINQMIRAEIQKTKLTKSDVIGLIKHHEREILDILLSQGDGEGKANQSFAVIEPKVRQIYSEKLTNWWRHIYEKHFGALYEPANLVPFSFNGIYALSRIISQTDHRIVFSFKTPADDAGMMSSGEHIYTLIKESNHWVISDYRKVPLTGSFSIADEQAIVQHYLRLQGVYGEVRYVETYKNNHVYESLGHYYMVGSDPQGVVGNVDNLFQSPK